MELHVNIEFNELLNMIRQLPAVQIEQIKADANEKAINTKPVDEKSEFQEFLLWGPVMSDDQYHDYLENRQQLIKWRSK